jgi:hypothetical protein
MKNIIPFMGQKKFFSQIPDKFAAIGIENYLNKNLHWGIGEVCANKVKNEKCRFL